ncbi:tyrosine-type recombinase/integrase [Bacillus inaquosorum]|uniref:tyrosine-type recombinase/integrase n=2 Tax=Bacillaceae TaxID=186817 RepID=UPI003D0515D9
MTEQHILNYTTCDYKSIFREHISKVIQENLIEISPFNHIDEITNYFVDRDIWNIRTFGTISKFINDYQRYNGFKVNIKFKTKNENIKLELKYFCIKKLFSTEWALGTFMTGPSNYMTNLQTFIDEEFPEIKSILSVELPVLNNKWRAWLEKNNFKTIMNELKEVSNKVYQIKSPIFMFLGRFYDGISTVFDDRDEWEKDIWDIRILINDYDIDFNPSKNEYLVNFSTIENPYFREAVKSYFKQRILAQNNFSWSTARTYVGWIGKFLNYVSNMEPTWKDLRLLSRQHIEGYIEWLSQYVKSHTRKDANPNRYKRQSLTAVNQFIRDLHFYNNSEIAPNSPVDLLILPGDKPRKVKKSHETIDYIPDFVLEQLFKNIDHLHKEVQPIVWIAFKTGLRISDVLGLKQNCLVLLNGKYSIVTDIEKTYVKGHMVPIDEELANIMAVLIDKAKKHSEKDNNPEDLIFVRYRGKRKGKAYEQGWVSDQLNLLARRKSITDELGNLFHFKMHQFRHTYAIKLLNNGTDIFTVQELLAHSSPEMTMVYAKLLDETKRKAYEKAVTDGVFSFDLNGNMYEVNKNEEIPEEIKEMLWLNHKLTAIDNPYGSCRARLNGNCPHAEEPPCLTCNGGSPCKDLAVGLSEMDIAKYKIHIQSTSKMVEVAKQYGREEIAQKNQKNLERLQDIYNTIKQGNIIFGRIERIKSKQGV